MRTDLAYGGICALQLSLSPIRMAIYLFSHVIVTHIWPLDHMPYVALASKWLNTT